LITAISFFLADRKKVLKHHPDKKAGVSVTHSTNDDAFFKCIQKANEVLTNPERRRQFDSVDPHYGALEEDAPSASDFKPAKGKDGKEKEVDPKRFFDEFGPVFEREARFSKKTPVPMLGVFEDGKGKVEAFYDFWYNFDSWRSFEYLDKEVNEGSDKYVVPPFYRPCCSAHALTVAATTNDTLKRRISLSVPDAKRRIPLVCVLSWT
jgi:DnaJ homolog subfamily C member 2